VTYYPYLTEKTFQITAIIRKRDRKRSNCTDGCFW
jgi:hypothetical protein